MLSQINFRLSGLQFDSARGGAVTRKYNHGDTEGTERKDLKLVIANLSFGDFRNDQLQMTNLQ
jgi:hypothetical protein